MAWPSPLLSAVAHHSEQRSQRWRAFGSTESNLTSSEIELQTSRTDSDAYNRYANWAFSGLSNEASQYCNSSPPFRKKMIFIFSRT